MSGARVATDLAETDIPQEEWFAGLFGFDEATALRRPQPGGQVVRDCTQMQAKFKVDGEQLVSLVNDRSFGIGTFSTPSLAELRESRARLPSGKLELKHVATRDVFQMHSDPDYKRATFMAASQFNCLEFAHPNATPEDGVNNYIYDRTQGPACALAAPAATVYRNYFVDVDGQVGQTEAKQLNLLRDVLRKVETTEGELVRVANGYTSSDDTRLAELNSRLANLDGEQLRGAMRVGLHSGVEVPFGPRRLALRPPGQRQTVTQVFASALAIGYSDGGHASWEPLARIVLDAAYEATLLSAAIEQAEGRGSGQVVLTFLGGGVFGNDPQWIEGAIARACAKLKDVPLRVVVCHFGQVDKGVEARLEAAGRKDAAL